MADDDVIAINCSRLDRQSVAVVSRPLLLECPDIIVGTPSRIVGHVSAGNIELKSSVEMVIIDEADLLFSFGYEQDMRCLLTSVIFISLFKFYISR